MAVWVGWVDLSIGIFGRIVSTYQGFGQAVRVFHVVESESTFDAQPVLIGGPIASLNRDDLVIL